MEEHNGNTTPLAMSPSMRSPRKLSMSSSPEPPQPQPSTSPPQAVENKFIYTREVWFLSALIARSQIVEDVSKSMSRDGKRKVHEERTDMKQKASDLASKIEGWITTITQKDMPHIAWNPQLQADVVNMARTVKIYNCTWNDYLSFHPHPYLDENRALIFDWVGYFEVELEYFADRPKLKETITPMMIQQVPTIVLRHIGNEYAIQNKNRALLIDRDSPIYVCVISNQMTNGLVKWERETIREHRKEVGLWTEIYSGAWHDYNEALYADRIRGNLSNRTSELHYLRRNSAFLFLEPENYDKFFVENDSYLRNYFLKPAAQIRAMQFALASINYSIDVLFLLQHARSELIGQKIEDLKKVRGNVYNKMSIIYAELDRNRRPHYTNVLSFLLQEFRFETILDRMNEKLEVSTDSLQLIYQKKLQDAQDRQALRLNILGILYGLGLSADIAGMLTVYLSSESNVSESIVNLVFVVVLIVSFFIVVFVWFSLTYREVQLSKVKPRKAAFALILTLDDKILMGQRKDPPFAFHLALPGSYVRDDETPEQAVVRGAQEDFHINIQVQKKLGEYKSPDQDPRGAIMSQVFLCEDLKSSELYRGEENLIVDYKPVDEVMKQTLAFDHLEIIEACLKILRPNRQASRAEKRVFPNKVTSDQDIP